MNELRVRDLMTEKVVSVRPQDSVEKIYDAMAEKSIRHLAVIDEEGDLVGVVSHRDLLRNARVERSDLPLSVQRELMRRMKVEEVMTSEVETAEPEQPLSEAAQVMFENKYGCLPVVSGWRVVGILTESDFVKFFTQH
ncbi:MAG TPA: CBS domain-containing protein [Thermoanaerobaculia bacterium]|nr:CBS domain-containing protein [Thermoanaerobaculia bacterium]